MFHSPSSLPLAEGRRCVGRRRETTRPLLTLAFSPKRDVQPASNRELHLDSNICMQARSGPIARAASGRGVMARSWRRANPCSQPKAGRCKPSELFAAEGLTAEHGSRYVRPSMRPCSSRWMAAALGTLGRPGIVMMSPQMATTKPAPAASRTSETGRT